MFKIILKLFLIIKGTGLQENGGGFMQSFSNMNFEDFGKIILLMVLLI